LFSKVNSSLFLHHQKYIKSHWHQFPIHQFQREFYNGYLIKKSNIFSRKFFISIKYKLSVVILFFLVLLLFMSTMQTFFSFIKCPFSFDVIGIFFRNTSRCSSMFLTVTSKVCVFVSLSMSLKMSGKWY
jgi:hypothetical protein